MSINFDVIIIGAGPAGGFCSYKLARGGLKVLVLEANSEIKRKICGEYLCPLGVELLREEELGEKVVDKFLPVKGMKIVPSNQNFILTNFPSDKKECIGLSVNRKEFDSLLLSLAQEEGAAIKFNQRVSSILKIEEGWRIETQRGESFDCKLLIGSDGINSFVAKELGFKSKVDTSRVSLHCHINNPSKNERYGELHLFADGSYIGIDPTSNHEVNVGLVCDSKVLKQFKDLRCAMNYYMSQSSELLSSFGEIPEGIKINAITPLSNKVSKFTGKDVALIGDAAGFIDPLTGEGIFNSLWMARSLVENICRSKSQVHGNYQVAIDQYAKDKNKFFKQKVLLNIVFQFVIRRPKLTFFIAKYLKKRQVRADTFIGIIGNIYKPIDGLFKLLLQ